MRFNDRGALSRAYGRVVECADVGSSVIEAEELRLRFAAPAKRVARMVESIYADGGLIWSTSHVASDLEGRIGRIEPASEFERPESIV